MIVQDEHGPLVSICNASFTDEVAESLHLKHFS